MLLPLLVAAPAVSERHAPPTDPARALPLLLRNLDESRRLLYVTAHPDDEDAALLVKLHHGMGIETALLTLTRGEGGQNEIGTELFHALGVLRSRELEAAGRYSGVRQYYSRAYEFGYSFSVEETFQKWNKEEILRDVVQVVREFRPDVILTMLPEGPGGGQHHQASAQISVEAFHVAAADRWPELGEPHQTARLFHQIWGDVPDDVTRRCAIDVGGYDPLLGAGYQEMGLASRGQHKCQGMARLSDPFPRRVSNWEWALPAGSDGVVLDDFFPSEPFGLGDLAAAAASIGERYRAEEPASVLEDLLELRTDLALATPRDRTEAVRLDTMRSRVTRAIQIAAGIRLEARAATRFVAAGGTLDVNLVVENVGDETIAFTLARRDVEVETDDGWRSANKIEFGVEPGQRFERALRLRIAEGATPTLHEPLLERAVPQGGPARVDPWWHAFSLTLQMKVPNGSWIALDPIRVERQERAEGLPSVFHSDPVVVPDPSVWPVLDRVAMPSAPGERRSHRVEFHVSSLDGGLVDVRLDAPTDWRVEPDLVVVETRAGGRATSIAAFDVTPPGGATQATLAAIAVHRESRRTSRQGVQLVEYPHIRPGGLLHDAVTTAVPFECETPDDVTIGYVDGSGDRVLEAIQRLGLQATRLSSTDLLEGDLRPFDVIVTGVRVFKVREDFKAAYPRVADWIEAGGTLVMQYNKFELNDGGEESPFAPYPARVGRRRITVEEAPVTVTLPEHPLFRLPNVLGPDTWDGWVQECGLYFLDLLDDRYDDLVSMEDPWPKNGGVKGGALVHASVGEGRWVYVGLGLFRQLPAAVPGAYRLLANLLSLGPVSTP